VAETVAAEELTGFSFRRAPPVARKRLEVDVAVAASGTVTLELALQGVPMVVFYRVHPMTWHIGRRLVTGISSLALPNILLNQQVVPEHVQHVKPTLVADEVVRLLGEEGHVQRLAFKALVDSVGPGDASSRAADILEEMLTLPHVEPDRRGEAHA